MSEPKPPATKREMHVSLLTMVTPAHNDYGLWAHPENQKLNYNKTSFWQHLARTCEEAGMDAIFFADALGIPDAYTGTIEPALRDGVHVPTLDPVITAASAMSVTTHLGWAATMTANFEPPYGLARRMATLDHLTEGRAGWNIVMSFLRNAEGNFGIDAGISSGRYDRAEDFMEVCYKLWEASWDEDAVLADTVTQEYIDPERVHYIDHEGEYFSSTGPALWAPSPQRTPVIFQAGSSTRGRTFAAKHAEVVFVMNRNDEKFRDQIVDIRLRAAEIGRGRDDLKILAMLGIIVGATEEEANAKLADYQKYSRVQGYLVHENAINGFDPMRFPREMLLIDALAEGGFLREETGVYARPDDWTVGDLIDNLEDLRAERMTIVGDPVQVADQLEAWMDEFDLDGFLLRSFLYPKSAEDFRDLVVPELQRRGRYRTEYEGTTLRENLFGAGRTRLPENHFGASLRRVPAIDPA
jgi:FMN-dependent oxidoreductase (nitrilotriacetate monooxygenase family)